MSWHNQNVYKQLWESKMAQLFLKTQAPVKLNFKRQSVHANIKMLELPDKDFKAFRFLKTLPPQTHTSTSNNMLET